MPQGESGLSAHLRPARGGHRPARGQQRRAAPGARGHRRRRGPRPRVARGAPPVAHRHDRLRQPGAARPRRRCAHRAPRAGPSLRHHVLRRRRLGPGADPRPGST